MLEAVEAKPMSSGPLLVVAPESRAPRPRLVDKHGNCLLGCGGECECLTYPRLPPEDDYRLKDDLYLMSGDLASGDHLSAPISSSAVAIFDSGTSHNPDANLCIRDKAMPPARDLTDAKVEHNDNKG